MGIIILDIILVAMDIVCVFTDTKTLVKDIKKKKKK